MHVNDPMRRYYWFLFICEGIVFASLLFQIIVATIIGRPNYFMDGYCVFFLLLLIFAFFSFRRRHQRTEARRQRALQGDPAFLAQPQPTPNANALEMPTKIHLRMSKKYLLELTGIMYVVFALIMIGVLVFLLPASRAGATVTFAIIGVLLAVTFVLFLVSFVLSLLVTGPLVEQEITVDEHGIITKFFRKNTHVPWNDVQSFAMWGSAKRFSVIQFEITSAHGIARWYQLGERRKFLTWLSTLKPDVPFEEYREKMSRLQQVIIARTGKPLYDLRDDKIVWW